MITLLNMVNPISSNERNELIDVLRGFALVGVLIANLQGWVVFALPEEAAQKLLNTTADRITDKFITVFIENKFISIFALLFGYGFGIIIGRLNTKDVGVNKFFIRRMLFLLLIGLIHIGIWWGEILSTYALCGMLLLMFRKCSNRGLLIWSGILFCFVAPGIQFMRWTMLPPAEPKGSALMSQYLAALRSTNLTAIAKSNYSLANFLFIERWGQFRDMAEILAKFLLGYFILRGGLLTETSIRSIGFKKILRWALLIAVFYLIHQFCHQYYENLLTQYPLKLSEYIFVRIGILATAFCYIAGICFLYYNRSFIFLFRCFKWIGMMSLTNYLVHTVCFILIYYGLGLGMLGKLHMQWTIPLALTIYSMQVIFCRWWLKHMLYGPVEWVWRQASYGKWLPIKIR